jgi:hypothetical protein
MTPYITEILAKINSNPSLIKTEYNKNFAICTLMQYAFDKNLKFKLPEGDPPFKPDEAPLGMSPSNFYQQVKKLYIFTRTDISNVRREQLFIQFLEGLHPSEAKVCIAIKDQDLTALYPNITGDIVADAGLVKTEDIFRRPQEKTQATGGRNLVLDLSDETTTKDLFGGKPPQEVQAVVQEKRKPGRPRKVV